MHTCKEKRLLSKSLRFGFVFAITAVTSTAFAGSYYLKTCLGVWTCSTNGTYSSFQECLDARKKYLKKNPSRSAECIMK